MVDREGPKTRRASREDLQRPVAEDQRPALDTTLKWFEQHQVIRRVAGDSPKHDLYLLYHDYLARGVLEAHRHRAEWRVRLDECARQWRRAFGWREKWRTLLGVPLQVRFAWERLRGRLRYGEHRAYAAWSLLPWVLLVLAVLLFVGLVRREVRLASARQAAREAIAALDGGPIGRGVSENAVRQLRALAAGDWAARKEAVRLALADRDAARRALPYAAMLAHATVGLDPFGKRSSELVSDCLEPLFRGPEPPGEVVFLAAQLLINFNVKDAQPLAKLLLKRMAMEEKVISFSRDWDETLGALAAMLDPEDVPAGTIAHVAEWKRDRETERQRGRQPVDPDLDELRQVLRRLGVDSDPKDLQSAAGALVKAMEKEQDSQKIAEMGRALGTVTAKLEPKDVRPAAAALVKHMEKEPTTGNLGELGMALGMLAAKLEPNDLRPGAAALGKRMEKKDLPHYIMAPLGKALGTLATRLEPKDLRPGAAALLKQIETEREADGSALLALGQALGRLTPGLSQRELSHAAEVLIPRLAGARHEWIYHTYEWNRGYYGDLEDLAELLAAADHQSLVDLLKSMPGAMPPIRAAALGALERKTGAKFDGDLWKFVDWATTDPEGRALELRLE
jgi:hypothetical protein